MLKRSKNLLTVHARKTLYFAQVHSILSYGIIIWGNMIPQVQLSKLQKLQDLSVQLIEPRKALSMIYVDHKILSIENIIRLENTKIWYKYYHALTPSRLSNLMTEDSTTNRVIKSHNYNTRQKNELNLPRASGHYKNSFYVKGMKDYSRLPNLLKNKPNLKQFTMACKNYLLGLNT